jgi:serine/threonine protein kinase
VLILDKYQILEEVGRGGMGLVYRAQDVRLGRIVALKELILNEGLTGKERDDIVARFQREAQTAASLSHINIVTIYDTGEEQGRHFIAMEFLKGKNLKDYITESHKFSFDQLLDIFIQTAEGLDHAHSMKIIHRDIKPSNIQVINWKLVKITDFGLAKAENITSSLTQDGEMFGTLGYISPEQLTDTKHVDSRADIFSFGAMMYEAVTGKLPFEGANIGASIFNIIHKDPFPIRDSAPNTPEDLEKIILKCLEKDPEKRYQAASEIVNDLNNCRNFTGKSNQIVISGAKPLDVSLTDTRLINTLDTSPVQRPSETIVLMPDEIIDEATIETLKKGQKVFIEEKLGSKSFSFGITWEFNQKKEFEIECCALLLSDNSKLEKEENFIFYNNLVSPDQSVKIDISDNQIYRKIIDVDLNKTAEGISRIKFFLNLDKNLYPNASFSQTRNLSIRAIGAQHKNLVYQVEDLSGEETIIMAEVYKRDGQWKLQASGEGYKLKLLDFLKLYAGDKIEISED